MKKLTVFIAIIVVVIGMFLLFFNRDTKPVQTVMTFSEYKMYIVSELVKKEYPGIDGYDASTLISVFKGLKNEDFDGIDTGYGVYEVDGGISFRPYDGVYEDSKLFLTEDNIRHLIDLVAKRLNQNIERREGFDTLITNIK